MIKPRKVLMDKHPSVLWWLSGVYALYMFAFWSIVTSLVLYMHGALHFDLKRAYSLFAVSVSLIWTLPLIGGYLSSRFGYRESAGIGLIFCVIGAAAMATGEWYIVLVGMASFVVGNAFFSPASWCLIDHAYSKDDSRRESGVTLFYLLFNIGAMTGTFIGGFVSAHFGYFSMFLMDACIMVAAFLLYASAMPVLKFSEKRSLAPQVRLSTPKILLALIFICVISVPFVAVLFHFPDINTALLYGISVAAFAVIFLVGRQQQDILKRKKVSGFILLVLISIIFYVLYSLLPSLLSVFAKGQVIKHIFGIHVPASSFFAFEGLFVVLIGIVLSRVWWHLGKNNKDPSTVYKFAASLICIGLGFVYLCAVLWSHGMSERLPMLMMIFCYAFVALGELLIVPVGISMVGRLAPHGHEGLFMGTWQLIQGVSAIFGGYLAKLAIVPAQDSVLNANIIYAKMFTGLGASSIVAGIAVFLVAPRIKRLLQ